MALNRERLKALSAVLKSVKLSTSTKFDMATFADVEIQRHAHVETKLVNGKAKTVLLDEGFCKTSACVLGYAALHPEFNKKGLKVQFYGESEFKSGTVTFDSGGRRFTDFQAGEKFFGLSEAQAEALFGGPWKSPKRAAEVIDQWLAGKIELAQDSSDFVYKGTEKYVK